MSTHSVKGQVIDAKTRQPLAGLKVEAWDKDTRAGALLGSAVTDRGGKFTIEFDRPPDMVFKVYSGDRQVAGTSDPVLWNAAQQSADIVIAIGQDSRGGGGTNGGGQDFEVRGRVIDDRGVAARGVSVDALDRNLSGTTRLGNVTTGADGSYSIRYRPPEGKAHADLQVRALRVNSDVRYDAGPLEIINLVLPTKSIPRGTEYERLLAAIRPSLGTASLGDLPAESVNYLANKSGWDPRSVAMAAQAARLAGSSKIPAAHYYALFRAGAPGDNIALSRLSSAFVEQSLRSAVDSTLIPGDADINATVAAHREQSAAVLQTVKPAGAVSTLGEMLDVRLDADAKGRFIQQYQIHGGTPSELWKALAANGFSNETIAALQTDGKLGYLTQHNAPLVRRLREQNKIGEAADLARAGLYKAQAWTDLIGNDVPQGITRDAYARGLAAQVNFSFPTLVVSEMVRRKEVSLSVAGPGDPGEEVADFLSAAEADHTIGREPVKTWRGYVNLSVGGRAGARLAERMYQISPSNESMMTLSRLGLHSALQVVSQPSGTFMKKYAGQFPSEKEARMVYRKSQEVHSTTLNLAITYIGARSTPNIYSMTGLQQKTESDSPVTAAAFVSGAEAAPIPGAATLEELFGNMDYCACDHCKSVLSPAAYLVELLQFIDLDPSDLEGGQNPIEVLRGRRPDIEHLLLSCENTNIALPYVDIVNEILEFFIVNGSLATFTGHDMGEDSVSEDLLADPQFVEDAAYVKTKDEVFPWTLPFDMPLAGMRLILETCDTTLAEALRLLENAAGARRERLGLNDGEHSILTSLAYRALPVYFGLPAATTIDGLNAQIANGKTFSRITGLSYEELVEILETEFVNPGVDLVPPLERLGISLTQLQTWYDGTLTDAQLQALFPADLDTAEYGDNVLTWLTDNRALIMGLIVLTDVGDPESHDECNFADVELRFALPDMNTNRLTALAYHKLLRFIRLWKKLGWSIGLVDDVMTTLLPTASQDQTEANIDAAFSGLLARIANLMRLLDVLSMSTKKIPAWLGIWDLAADVAVRQERLAALLRIGITDMIDLAEISGIDPLAQDMEADAPSLLRFVDRWLELKAIRLKVADLNYILRHRDDSGKLTPTEASLLRGIKLLRDGLTAVDADMTIAPGNADLAFAKAKMALVYDNAVVNRFFSLIDGTTSYTAPFVMAEEVLPAPITAVDSHLTWDPYMKLLTFTGILAATARAALDTAADNLVLADMAVITTQPALDAFIADFKTATGILFNAGAQDLTNLDTDYPELKIVYDAVQAAADPAAKNAVLLDGILPALRAQLKTLSLRGTLVSLLAADPPVVDALTSGPVVLHANGDAAHGVLADFEHLQSAVTFDANQTYRFYVDPPATDNYILYVRAPQNTTVTLTLSGGLVIPATVLGASGEVKTNVPISLTAGALVLGELTLAGLPGGSVAELSWRTKGMAQAAVPASRIYAEAQLIAARASLIRLQKAAMLRRLLSLTPRELIYFAGSNAGTLAVLNDLDVDGSIAGPALIALWNRVALLAWFAGLKQENEPDENTWVGILENPAVLTAQGALLILGVNGWKASDLTDVLNQFALTVPDLSQITNLRRVKQVLDWVVNANYPAADLLSWSNAAPGAAVLAAAKASIRAKLEDAPWRETMKSVNDALRNQRRDALVAYILYHQQPTPAIDTADKLYEHFLIDVQMDACMQTSRIRAALSTVQLFIFRCFMNLEQDVAPAALDSRKDRWAYMKRYRVWEANRKIFLYPENWLESELRDNKSSFFNELESALLKADITTELAEDAYLSYLKKLDDVARLEIVGTALEPKEDGDPDDDVVHVFGRTNGDTRQYYYRRFEGGYWLPWEKVSLNIQGDLVFPMVWKGRLFVFWLNIIEKAQGAKEKSPQDMSNETWTGSAKKTAEITIGWGEYYKGKWSSPKSSDLKEPIVVNGLTDIHPRHMFMVARTEVPSPLVSERLLFWLVHLDNLGSSLLTFTSKNVPPIIQPYTSDSPLLDLAMFNYYLFWEPEPSGAVDANSLRVPEKIVKVSIQQPPHAAKSYEVETLVTKQNPLHAGYYIRPLMNQVENQWEAPFFYYDEHSTFYVTPNETVTHVRDYDGYFGEVVAKVPKDIGPLYEIPIPDPIGPIENPQGPIINPGEGIARGINRKAQVVLPDNSQFSFGGATFGASGIMEVTR